MQYRKQIGKDLAGRYLFFAKYNPDFFPLSHFSHCQGGIGIQCKKDILYNWCFLI